MRAPVTFPHSQQVYGKEIIFPKDGEAGGGWIGATDFSLAAVILNGANEPHRRNPPYRLSRGKVLLDALECIRPQEFVKNYDFTGIEPFTLVMIYDDSERVVVELVWDGKQKWEKKHHPASPHIWASKMLYDDHAVQLRQTWFDEWLATKPDFSQENIIDFHYNAVADNPETAMRMNRDGQVATISITSMHMSPMHCNMHYYDLRNDSRCELVFQELPISMYAYIYDQN